MVSFDMLTPGSRIRISTEDGDHLDITVLRLNGKILVCDIGTPAVTHTIVFADLGGGVKVDSPYVRQNLVRQASLRIEPPMIGALATAESLRLFRVTGVQFL